MGATTKKISTAPAGSDQLRGGIIDYLQKSGFDKIGAQTAGPVSVAPWSGGTLDRGQIRDVTGERTQSVDQLGGANSAFFNNMVGQLAPAFDTQRQLAAAAGKEAAGNLTGSGFANRLGNNLGRTLGDQQALLADYATRGLQMETQRQAGDADRVLRGDLANQGADQSFLSSLLQNRGLDLQARGQDIGVATGNADRADANSNANASRFLQLLMQQGQPYQDAIVQSGGAGQLLGPLAQGLGAYYGGGGQGNPASGLGGLVSQGIGKLGGWLGGLFGGGGGGDPTGGIAAGNKTAGGIDFGSLGNIGSNMMLPGPQQTGMQNIGGMGSAPVVRGGTGFAPGENNIFDQIRSGGQGGGIGSILQMILGGGGGGGQQSGLGGILGSVLGKTGGIGTTAGGIAQLLNGGFNAKNIGGILGGIAGNAIPIPVLGPMLGSILGKGVGSVAGKIGGGIKNALGKIFSDEELKSNIRPMGDGIETIRSLNPVRFDYTKGPKNQLGFIAQDMQRAIPEAVSKHKSGYLQIRPDFVIPHLVTAVQQIDKRTQ